MTQPGTSSFCRRPVGINPGRSLVTTQSINSSVTLVNGSQDDGEKIDDSESYPLAGFRQMTLIEREGLCAAGADKKVDSRSSLLTEAKVMHIESDPTKIERSTFLSRGRAAHWLQTENDLTSPVTPPPIVIPSALSQLLHDGRAAHWRCTETP